ncbi:MAG: hypothetical protein RLN62_06875 [Rickettsiales bacterium]
MTDKSDKSLESKKSKKQIALEQALKSNLMRRKSKDRKQNGSNS